MSRIDRLICHVMPNAFLLAMVEQGRLVDLQIVRRAIEERGLDKVIIHPTLVPRVYLDAFRKGQIRVARLENGFQIYEKTEKADVAVDYFPGGRQFLPPETRKALIELAVAEHTVDFVVTNVGVGIYWDGTTNNIWDISTTPNSPMVWAKPSTAPVRKPGRARGTATDQKVSQREARSVAATSSGRSPNASRATRSADSFTCSWVASAWALWKSPISARSCSRSWRDCFKASCWACVRRLISSTWARRSPSDSARPS